MLTRARVLLLVLATIPGLVAAQAPSPVANAFRGDEAGKARILIAAAVEMPAEAYGFKATPAQLSFAQVVMHLAEGNDFLCGVIGGVKPPARTKVAEADGKDVLVGRLKETFKFCDDVLAPLDDAKLGEELPFFGGRMMTRAAIMTVTTGDWADHYSQSAIYLRLNGHLPPTAKKP
ncbi:MAG: DinB family protein [Gemmatimonadales bacterium]